MDGALVGNDAAAGGNVALLALIAWRLAIAFEPRDRSVVANERSLWSRQAYFFSRQWVHEKRIRFLFFWSGADISGGWASPAGFPSREGCISALGGAQLLCDGGIDGLLVCAAPMRYLKPLELRE